MLYYLDEPVPPRIQGYLRIFDSPHLKDVNEKTQKDKNEAIHLSKSGSLPRERSKPFNKNEYEAARPQSATLFRETKRKLRQKKSNKNQETEKQEYHINSLNKSFPFFKTVHDENDNLIGKDIYEIPMKSLNEGHDNICHKRYDSRTKSN